MARQNLAPTARADVASALGVSEAALLIGTTDAPTSEAAAVAQRTSRRALKAKIAAVVRGEVVNETAAADAIANAETASDPTVNHAKVVDEIAAHATTDEALAAMNVTGAAEEEAVAVE
jgi:hypothetical protein